MEKFIIIGKKEKEIILKDIDIYNIYIISKKNSYFNINVFLYLVLFIINIIINYYFVLNLF